MKDLSFLHVSRPKFLLPMNLYNLTMNSTHVQQKYSRVSVLIVSNSVKYLKESLDSVLKQDYFDFEIVVILNGSAIEHLEELTTYYCNSSKRVIFRECLHENVVTARNLGVNTCDSELICLLDSDDLMPSGRISRQVNEFNTNPQLVCLGGQLLNLKNSVVSKFHFYPTSFERTKHSLSRFSSLPHPGVMFRKSSVIQAGLYNETYPWIEDWNLWVRLLSLGEVYNLDVPTVIYRRHESQVTQIHSKEMGISIKLFLWNRLHEILKGFEERNHKVLYSKRKSLYINGLMCLILNKVPKKKDGFFGKRELRRCLASINYYQFKGLKISKTFLKGIHAVMCIKLDPKFFMYKSKQLTKVRSEV